jgi:acyl-CoA thioesterase YciA
MTVDKNQKPRGHPTIRMLAMPKDTNWLGDIFGGWLMSHADIAGGNLAYGHAGGNVVTVAVDDFEFIRPVYVGDVVTFYARICKTGTTSITVGIEMFVDRPGDPPDHHFIVASATMIYVHIGDDRRPRPIPEELPESQ